MKLMLLLAMLTVAAILTVAVFFVADKTATTASTQQLYVYVTNQSPTDDPIHIEVSLDGHKIFDNEMPHCGGHYSKSVSTKVTSGVHTLSARSKTTKASETIKFDAQSTNWYGISYWNYTTNHMYGPVPSQFKIQKLEGPFMMR